jgi:hypothetical protein
VTRPIRDRFALRLAIVVLASIPTTAVASADATWLEHHRAARAAFGHRDYAGHRAWLLIVAGSMGEQPGVSYGLAGAAARRR